MAGISLLRPQYSSLGSVAARFAAGARQVAHETDPGGIAGVSESHGNGGQEEALQEPRLQPPFDQGAPRDDRQAPPRRPPPPSAGAAAAAPREPAGEFHVDPHLPPPERMVAVGLMVAQPLPMPERLRAAQQAYGASRDILRGIAVKPGNGFDSAL
jgi:hypothetical protein